jgi:hypothetical protein
LVTATHPRSVLLEPPLCQRLGCGVVTGMVKSLWASIQGDPVFMRRVNGWLTIFWIAMIPISIVTGWIDKVTYVAALSLWALVSGHWSAWQAARVEVNQQKQAERQAGEDIAQDVVERVVEETNVQRQRP